MKFGVFLPNGSNGYIPSAGSPVYPPTFRHNLEISLEAERQGLDFVLSMMKYRGFGGETGYWDACLESFTLMSAIAAATETIGLFPSISILSQHPAVVARMVATIDDVSQGRCGLNIVTGWNRAEYAQMGMWPGDEHYERRYEYAAEYVQILKTLWADGRCTFDGEFFKLDDCTVYPQPSREIPIVCAGQSPRGRQFVAEQAHHQFVLTGKSNLNAGVADIKSRAAATGREVGIYALYHMIVADTDAQAQAMADDIVARADQGAIRNILASASLDTNTEGTADQLKAALAQGIDEGNMAFMGVPVVLGSPATVAAQIDEISRDTGVDGLLFSWPDFVPGIRRFGTEVMPRLDCLRAA
ncbi:MAG: LLM class flavin-dependent oxidoreductase [Gammaproteobacteria bacterium]